jgi:hypothetical protein
MFRLEKASLLRFLNIRDGFVQDSFANQHKADFVFVFLGALHRKAGVGSEELGELLLINVNGELFIE